MSHTHIHARTHTHSTYTAHSTHLALAHKKVVATAGADLKAELLLHDNVGALHRTAAQRNHAAWIWIGWLPVIESERVNERKDDEWSKVGKR